MSGTSQTSQTGYQKGDHLSVPIVGKIPKDSNLALRTDEEVLSNFETQIFDDLKQLNLNPEWKSRFL